MRSVSKGHATNAVTQQRVVSNAPPVGQLDLRGGAVDGADAGAGAQVDVVRVVSAGVVHEHRVPDGSTEEQALGQRWTFIGPFGLLTEQDNVTVEALFPPVPLRPSRTDVNSSSALSGCMSLSVGSSGCPAWRPSGKGGRSAAWRFLVRVASTALRRSSGVCRVCAPRVGRQPVWVRWHGTQNRACGRISSRSTGMVLLQRSQTP